MKQSVAKLNNTWPYPSPTAPHLTFLVGIVGLCVGDLLSGPKIQGRPDPGSARELEGRLGQIHITRAVCYLPWPGCTGNKQLEAWSRKANTDWARIKDAGRPFHDPGNWKGEGRRKTWPEKGRVPDEPLTLTAHYYLDL